MPRRSISMVLYVGFAIVILAIFSIRLGSQDILANPVSDSYAPSGLAAAAELCRKIGYKVERSSMASKPKDTSKILVIPFVYESTESESDARVQANEAMREFVNKGGRILAFSITEDFAKASRTAILQTVSLTFPRKKRSYRMSTAFSNTHSFLVNVVSNNSNPYPAVVTGVDKDFDSIYYSLAEEGLGTWGVVGYGLFATNRFIDQADNARLFRDIVEDFAPKGSTLVFMDPTSKEQRSNGLMASIGPWAEGAWWQTVCVFFTIVIGFGVRFGFSRNRRSTQSSGKELANALSFFMRRSKRTDLALSAVLELQDERLKSALRIPSSTKEEVLIPLLPPSVLDARQKLVNSIKQAERIPIDVALSIAKSYENEVLNLLKLGKIRVKIR